MKLGLSVGWVTCLGWGLTLPGCLGGTVLYETQFERDAGFEPYFALAGQVDWSGTGPGASGLTSTVDGGQQAFIGGSSPGGRQRSTFLGPPLLSHSNDQGHVLQFSVLLTVVSSVAGPKDDFRWNAYNHQGERLFSLGFDTGDQTIFAVLDDGTFLDSTYTFEPSVEYELTILMDTERNTWTARVNNAPVIPVAPMTMKAPAPALGTFDAVWVARDMNDPGDNYMLFDNYSVKAEQVASIPPLVQMDRLSPGGEAELTVFGQPGLSYSVEVSENSVVWESLGVFEMPSTGYFFFEDTTAGNHPLSFYRTISVPVEY
jgi:hypothetical protein